MQKISLSHLVYDQYTFFAWVLITVEWPTNRDISLSKRASWQLTAFIFMDLVLYLQMVTLPHMQKHIKSTLCRCLANVDCPQLAVFVFSLQSMDSRVHDCRWKQEHTHPHPIHNPPTQTKQTQKHLKYVVFWLFLIKIFYIKHKLSPKVFWRLSYHALQMGQS